MTTVTDENAVEGEMIGTSTAIDIRHPAAPATLEQIAALGDGANEIVRARIQVLQTLRRASIQATMPEDWLLFHASDRRTGQERTVGYLQDAGCDRVASLWGIEVFGIEKPERIMANDGTANFMYLVLGSGRCSITGQTVEQMEGGRSSSDDFCKDEHGTALELKVRKAARANLDGNIVRELTGLKSVPLSELQSAWEGSSKDWNRCVKGRGFGSGKAENIDNGPVSTTPVPNCPTCNGPMWDNRAKKQSPKSPDFKCKDPKCNKAVWENDKPKAQAAAAGSSAGGPTPADEAAGIKKQRALMRGKFSQLGWDEKRQDQFCGARDISALKLDELVQLNASLDEVIAGA
jgi:hypothetical protein